MDPETGLRLLLKLRRRERALWDARTAALEMGDANLLVEIEEQIRDCEKQLLTELGCFANRPVEDFVPAVRRKS